MVGAVGGACRPAVIPGAELMGRCWVTGGDAELMTEHFLLQGLSKSLLRGVTGASLAAWDQQCRYQLEVKKKCAQAGLLLTVAAGSWVGEHKCVPVLGAA